MIKTLIITMLSSALLIISASTLWADSTHQYKTKKPSSFSMSLSEREKLRWRPRAHLGAVGTFGDWRICNQVLSSKEVMKLKVTCSSPRPTSREKHLLSNSPQ